MIHFYCLAVQAGFYSDAAECRTESNRPGSIPGRGIKNFSHVISDTQRKYQSDGFGGSRGLMALFARGC